jgi:hypothetical protein
VSGLAATHSGWTSAINNRDRAKVRLKSTFS